MNNITLFPAKVKIRKFPPYFSGFFISLEWHFCISNLALTGGHNTYEAIFPVPQGWLYKRGTASKSGLIVLM